MNGAEWRGLGLPATIVVLGIAALWIWSIPRAISSPMPDRALGTFDYHNYFLPRFEFGSVEMSEGRLPIWNDFEYAGIPFLATAQPAVLYPPKILAFASLDSERAMVAFLIVHYVLLAGGFLLFARRMGIGGLGALAGVVYWTFATTVLVSNYHPNRIACLVWVPVVFWLAERIARAWDGPAIAGFACVIALQLVAGYPAFTLSLIPLLFVHAIAMYGAGLWSQPPWATLPRVAAAFALGACIASLQLLPLAEIAQISERTAYAANNAPPFLDSIQSLTSERGPSGWNFVFMAFPGLACFWLAALVRKNAAPAAGGVLACVFFGFGGWLIMRVLPGFSMIRHGLVWFFLMQFYFAWLVALGAQRFEIGGDETAGLRNPRVPRWTRVCVAGASMLWVALCAWNLAPEADSIAAADTQELAPPIPVSSMLYGDDLSISLGLIGGLLLVGAAFAHSPIRKWVGIAGVVALMLGQLAGFPFGGASESFARPELPLRLSALAELASVSPSGRAISEIDRAYGTNLTERVALMTGMELSFAQPRARALQQRLVSRRTQRVFWGPVLKAGGLLDAMNVEWLVGPTEYTRAFAKRGLQSMGSDEFESTLYHNTDSLGEAWVAYGVREFERPEQTLEYVLSSDFDPRHEVLVETPLSSRYRSRALQLPTPALVRRPSPTRVEVEVETAQPGILVLADAWYPSWEAHINGEPTPILRVNYLLRGVELPAGSHSVHFAYRPTSIRWGALSSGLGLLIALLLVWAPPRRIANPA